jgi:hypothetical protein
MLRNYEDAFLNRRGGLTFCLALRPNVPVEHLLH